MFKSAIGGMIPRDKIGSPGRVGRIDIYVNRGKELQRVPAHGAGSPDAEMQRIRKRSVTIAGHRTSVSLEDAFWVMLQQIAAARGQSIGDLITQIDRERAGNVSSAVRVFVLAEALSGTQAGL